MSLTVTQRNLNITQVLQQLCEAEAVVRCNSGYCAAPVAGVGFTDLLLALQLSYPSNTWDTDQLTATLTYMRQRGVVLFQNNQYYLNYDMIDAGGENQKWAKLCPLVRQPLNCCTYVQAKYPSCPIECTQTHACEPNPYDGCCPPLLPQ